MKNYLFTPFDDDNDKIETFNHLKNYLSSGHRNELIMFIGRLESYYDAEICRLREEHDYNEGIAWGNGKVQELQVEVNDLRKACKLLKEDNKRLQDELQAVNDDYFESKFNIIEDGLLEEIKELKADIKKHEKQYHMMASSKEYKAEAEEYFDHNPQADKLFFFMITEFDMKDAENGDLMLSEDDAICIINNERS